MLHAVGRRVPFVNRNHHTGTAVAILDPIRFRIEVAIQGRAPPYMEISVLHLTAIQKRHQFPELNFISLFVSSAHFNLTEFQAPVAFFSCSLIVSRYCPERGCTSTTCSGISYVGGAHEFVKYVLIKVLHPLVYNTIEWYLFVHIIYLSYVRLH